MTRRRDRLCRARAAWGRSGFAFPLVLLVILVGGLFLAAAFERQDSQRRIVTSQLAEYRRHHEVFGVRAILAKWLSRVDEDRLLELATPPSDDDPKLAFGFELPSGAVVKTYLRDGQGLVHSAPEGLADDLKEIYDGILERLPDRPGLRRRHGPNQLSLSYAPEAVLRALVPKRHEEFAERTLRRRERRELDADEVDRLLRVALPDQNERAQLMRLLTFEPSVWRLDVEIEYEDAQDGNRERRYTMLLEVIGAGAGRSVIQTLDWFETPASDDEEDSDAEELEARSDRASRDDSRSG